MERLQRIKSRTLDKFADSMASVLNPHSFGRKVTIKLPCGYSVYARRFAGTIWRVRWITIRYKRTCVFKYDDCGGSVRVRMSHLPILGTIMRELTEHITEAGIVVGEQTVTLEELVVSLTEEI